MELTKAFYSPAEVAQLVDLHPTTILNYIRDDKLFAVRLSERTIRIPARSVQKLLAPDEAREPRLVERPHADVQAAAKEEGEAADTLVPA